jgi:Zn-dependent peptidase ImmA (M78 family)
VSAEDAGRRAAGRFRLDHQLGMQPLGDLVALIEQVTGIDVAVIDAAEDAHGLTMRDPARGVVFVAVARTIHPMRQRSTLAHELGHILFEDWAAGGTQSSNGRHPAEVRADAFARHLLIPLDGLRQFLAGITAVTEVNLSAIVQRFLVSPSIAAIALQQAGYITDDLKQQWRALTTPRLAVRFGWSDHYRTLQADSDHRRAPQRLLARAIKGYEQGVLPAQAIATLRGITREAAEADLSDAGVVPAEQRVLWASPADLPTVSVDLAELDDDLASPDIGDEPPTESKSR